MPPQVILCAANGRPYELQDLLPSDSRFKLIVFAGDLEAEAQYVRIETFAKAISGGEGVLTMFGRRSGDSKGHNEVFEVLTIMVGKKEIVNYTRVPAALRSHWTKCDFSYMSPDTFSDDKFVFFKGCLSMTRTYRR